MTPGDDLHRIKQTLDEGDRKEGRRRRAGERRRKTETDAKKCKDRATCLKEAEVLRAQHKYFRWPEINALIGWLRHGGTCVYCGKNLMTDWESLFGSAHTDHLLPRGYEEILWDDWNLVLCCSVCNSLKRHYDANEYLPSNLSPDQGGRYGGGPHLTEQQHIAIIELCKKKVDELRSRRKTRWIRH